MTTLIPEPSSGAFPGVGGGAIGRRRPRRRGEPHRVHGAEWPVQEPDFRGHMIAAPSPRPPHPATPGAGAAGRRSSSGPWRAQSLAATGQPQQRDRHHRGGRRSLGSVRGMDGSDRALRVRSASDRGVELLVGPPSGSSSSCSRRSPTTAGRTSTTPPIRPTSPPRCSPTGRPTSGAAPDRRLSEPVPHRDRRYGTIHRG